MINKELLAVISKSKKNQGRLDLEPSSFTISCALIPTLVLPLGQFDCKHRHDADQTPPQRPKSEYLRGIVSSWLYLERSSTHRHSSLRLSTSTRAGSSRSRSVFRPRLCLTIYLFHAQILHTCQFNHVDRSLGQSDCRLRRGTRSSNICTTSNDAFTEEQIRSRISRRLHRCRAARYNERNKGLVSAGRSGSPSKYTDALIT